MIASTAISSMHMITLRPIRFTGTSPSPAPSPRSVLHLDPVWRRPTAVGAKESGLKRLDRSAKVEPSYNSGPVPRFPTGSAARDLLWVYKASAGDAHRWSRPSHQILPGVRIGGTGKSSRGNFATLKVVDQQPLARRRIAGMPPRGDRIPPWQGLPSKYIRSCL